MDNTKILIDPNANWDGLDLEIHFSTPIVEDKQKEIEEKISYWVKKGIDEGYDGEYINYEDKSTWSSDNEWFKVWLDLGTAEESIFEYLEEILSSYPVDRIFVGYDYPDDRYEMDDETSEVLRDLQQSEI